MKNRKKQLQERQCIKKGLSDSVYTYAELKQRLHYFPVCYHPLSLINLSIQSMPDTGYSSISRYLKLPPRTVSDIPPFFSTSTELIEDDHPCFFQLSCETRAILSRQLLLELNELDLTQYRNLLLLLSHEIVNGFNNDK